MAIAINVTRTNHVVPENIVRQLRWKGRDSLQWNLDRPKPGEPSRVAWLYVSPRSSTPPR